MRPGLMALAAAPVREALGADDAPPEAVSGMLWKLGANVKNWKERTFVLSEGRLCYYRRETVRRLLVAGCCPCWLSVLPVADGRE